jgi:hypothetical protein
MAATGADRFEIPDFTKGGRIPDAAVHDWTLGATGARGWIYSDQMVTSDARQIAITRVDKGSPADGILATGDVILGLGGKPFSFDPRTEFGRALTLAESEEGGGKLHLQRWRGGKTEELVVQIPVLGSYSATAPYACGKSSRILQQGCKALAGRMGKASYKQNPITRSLNALALLASGESEYIPLVRREARWAADFSATGMQSWYYSYVILLLSEYVMATGDESVMVGLRRLALEAAKGQSAVGSWGHKFAEPDGRLSGYGMMNAPGVPLTFALLVARDAGVKDPAIDRAIHLSSRLTRFYLGKGAIPYGDHHPWTQTHEDNGKCGMAAVLFDGLGDVPATAFFSRMSLASHGAERDGGHTGNFFNILWALPGVSRSGPQATGAWMAEFGAWYFDLARRWDGSFLHQGPPDRRKDSYPDWDSSGAYLLAYAMPLQKIRLTGKRPSVQPPLTAAAAQAVIADGRGWSNKDRKGSDDRRGEAELLLRLGSWSPVVRERAAMALARRESKPIAALLRMLENPVLAVRYGACQALAECGGDAAEAVPELRQLLRHEDLWLRVSAANALSAMGEPAMPAVPDLLERLAMAPSKDDPRGMEQRYLCFAVFGKLLKKSLRGVDRVQLRKAISAGLLNQDGRARGELGGIYQQLSYDEIAPLLPAIHESIRKPAPSGEMFASEIRLSGLELFAKHRIREGMELCFQVMEIDRWGKGRRIPRCLKSLAKYGAAAKPMLPRLRQLESELRVHPEAKTLQAELAQVRSLIQDLESATGHVELRSLSS